MTPRQISALRRKLEKTQAELAVLLSVSSNTVARWERGELEPGPESIRALTALLEGPKKLALADALDQLVGSRLAPFYTGPTQWTSPSGQNYWKPTGRPIVIEVVKENPYAWKQSEVWSVRLFVGLSVGAVPTWSLDDVVKYVAKHWQKPASFLLQRGIWGKPPDLIVEDSVQVLIVNTGVDLQEFKNNMEVLAEQIAKDFEQEEVVLELQKNGVSVALGGIVPRPGQVRKRKKRKKRR